MEINLGQLLTAREHSDAVSVTHASPKPRLTFPKSDDSSVRVVRQLLHASECRELVSAVEGLSFSSPTSFEARDRVCERIHTIDPSMSANIMSRLRPFVPEVLLVDGARWRLTRFTHHWRYVRYFRGGHFAPHYDGSKLLPWQEMTMFTVQVYLNSRGEDFDGGDTRFYMDHVPERQGSHSIVDGQSMRFFPEAGSIHPTHSVRAVAGSALVFDHCGRSVFHDGEPVSKGCKYIMRGDLLYAALPEDSPVLRQPTLPAQRRSWCASTAARFGTRDFIGQVWTCKCAQNQHGAGCCKGLFQDAPCDDPASAVLARPGFDGSGTKQVCVLISGKRASGKDFLASVIQAGLESEGLKVHRSAAGSINKRVYAAKVGVDFARLESDRDFKESHRIAMVQHHQACNREDPGWCFEEIWREAQKASADVLLLTDLRTQLDLRWFTQKHAALVLFRIEAGGPARARRGWRPDATKDALYSETDLDAFEGWDACFDNSADRSAGLVDEWVRHTAMPRILARWGARTKQARQ